jgi:lipopolysaccharide export LptBFGC system permease protein LptF
MSRKLYFVFSYLPNNFDLVNLTVDRLCHNTMDLVDQVANAVFSVDQQVFLSAVRKLKVDGNPPREIVIVNAFVLKETAFGVIGVKCL